MASLVSLMINGYNPAYDRKQLEDLTIVDGKNFAPTLQGYKSNFGSSAISFDRLPKEIMQNSNLFLKLDRLFMVNNFGVLKYDETNEKWYYIIKLGSKLYNDYPWSSAVVGGDIYFCRLGAGLWRYRITDNSVISITENVPSDAMSICSADGRLVILGSSTYAWSAVGDGTSLATSIGTGAGFQALTLAGSGSPLGVKSLNDGFLVFTTTGIVKAEAISSVLTFYHRLVANSSFTPVSPNAICEVESGTILWFSRTGLYSSNGGYPEQFEPEFSKYLVTNIFKYPLASNFDVPIRVGYSELMHYIIISYSSSNGYNEPFITSYIYDIDLAKWGRYDYAHWFMADIKLTGSKYRGIKLALGSENNTVKVINKDYGTGEFLDYDGVENYTATVIPMQITNGNTEVSSAMTMKSYDFTSLPNLTGYYKLSIVNDVGVAFTELYKPDDTFSQPIGVDMLYKPDDTVDMLLADSNVDMNLGEYSNKIYDIAEMIGNSSNWANRLMQETLVNLDSNIIIAPYHIGNFEDIRTTTVMTDLAVVGDQTVAEDSIIDMLTIDNEIDMANVSEEFIGMGYGITSTPEYDLTLSSSSDAYGHKDYHLYSLQPVDVAGNMYTYNIYSTGLYHGFKFNTNKAGSYYHVKQLQANIFQGGLIYG